MSCSPFTVTCAHEIWPFTFPSCGRDSRGIFSGLHNFFGDPPQDGEDRPGFVERAKSEEHEARVTVEAVTLTNMVGPYWNALGTPGTPA